MKTIEELKNTIIQGDCLQVMKDIPDKSVDLVLTDPPYNYDFNYASNCNDNLKEQEYFHWCKKWFNEIQRISKCLVITIGLKNIYGWIEIENPLHIACWAKPNAMTAMKNVKLNCWEPILIYGELKKPINYDLYIHNISKQKDTGNHPCPKQPIFWKKLVLDYSEEGDIVLDPFLGSGTTAVACKHLKRNFIGIELSEEYCEIARQRLRQDILL